MIPEKYTALRWKFLLVGGCLGVLSDVFTILNGHSPSNAEQLGELFGEPVGGALVAWIVWRIGRAFAYKQNPAEGNKPQRGLSMRLFIAVLPTILVYGGIFALVQWYHGADSELTFVESCERSCIPSLKMSPILHKKIIPTEEFGKACSCYCEGLEERMPTEMLNELKGKTHKELESNLDFTRIVAEMQKICYAPFSRFPNRE